MSFLPGSLRAAYAQSRWPSDWYVEPPDCVASLFDAQSFSGAIYDPACGGGTIPRVARERGYKADGSDLVFRGFGRGGVDFLSDGTPRENIVTNPPYRLAEEFARHALKVTQGSVALVTRISFLNGQRRAVSLYDRHPPALVLVLSARPSMPPGGTDIPAKGGTADYVWIVWDQGYEGPTILRFSGSPKRQKSPAVGGGAGGRDTVS